MSAKADLATRPAPGVILLVEDEPLVRITIAEHLRGAGYRVIEAGSADEAVSVLSSGAKVHLVFSDVELPGAMGGFSLAVWIRKHHDFIPVVLASGVSSVILPLAHQNLVPFISKPYRPEDAEQLIASVLASSVFAKRD